MLEVLKYFCFFYCAVFTSLGLLLVSAENFLEKFIIVIAINFVIGLFAFGFLIVG